MMFYLHIADTLDNTTPLGIVDAWIHQYGWDEIEARSFIAKYSGYSYDGEKIKPGDRISRLSSGGYVLID